jgi:hypothetical protein
MAAAFHDLCDNSICLASAAQVIDANAVTALCCKTTDIRPDPTTSAGNDHHPHV